MMYNNTTDKSVTLFKRLPSGLDYVDNAYEFQKEVMIFASKLSARWARIFQQPVDNLACRQADFVNMAYSINAKSVEDYITRRWLIKMLRAVCTAVILYSSTGGFPAFRVG